MSAPLQGRNSPEPELQTGAQQQSVPGSGKLDSGSGSGGADTSSSTEAPTQTQSQSQSSGTDGLESNPKGPLEGGVTGK
jgi:hypothetical protein